MDSDDGGPFSLAQPLTDSNGYPVSSSSIAGQYHVWAAAAAVAGSAAANNNNNTSGNSSSNNTNTASLPTHFSPVSPTGHGMYSDHLSLHPSQSAVDALSVRLVQGDYNHSAVADRLSQGGGGGGGESYHGTGGSDNSGRHQTGQPDYHDHLVAQDRHLALDSYHHISAASSSDPQQSDRLAQPDYHATQQADRLGQAEYHQGQQSSRMVQTDYHTGQQADRLGQNDYHSTQQQQQQDRLGQGDYHAGQQSDRLGQADYHVSPQPDRLGQLDYHSGQSERLSSLSKQDYHGLSSDRLGQQTATYHSGPSNDRGLTTQPDYHAAQVDLDAVGMHPDFDRRHLDVSMLPKELVDSGQRGSAMDYLTSSRDYLASLVGLPRELDLSVGQTVSPPQRSAPSDLASTSHGLDTATLPRDFSPYSQRDLDRAMMSTSDVVVGQVGDGSSRGVSVAGTNINLHPQDLAGINLVAAPPRDLVDMTSFGRSGSSHDDMGRARDVLHRPRDVQRALEDLGSLENGTVSVDLTLNGGNSTKSSSRSYSNGSRLTSSSSKRQTASTSQTAEVRTQNSLPLVPTSTNGNGINFFSLPSSRDALNIMVSDQSAAGTGPSRHGVTTDFTRQPGNEMSRLRRELSAPYSDLGVHHSMLASTGAVPVTTFKNTVEPLFNAHGDQLICNDALMSSRERLYEMMKQQQFCDAVIATTLHSIKVHKAVLCSASAYLCGVLSQTCMGKSGGRVLTVQFKADIPASSLSAFIDFIYQGRIKLSIKSARDLNVMARCLHMESLKKTSEEMLLAMGLSNDLDLNIPELLLLETLVDKFDKSCAATFPVPAPAPESCEVGVATDSSFLPPTGVDGSCQTDDVPATCSCSNNNSNSCSGGSGSSSIGAIDLRSGGGGSLRLGGLGTLSLAVNGGAVTCGVNVNGGGGGRIGEPNEPALMTTTSEIETPSAATLPSASVAKPHPKKHLASQASRAKAEAAATAAAVAFTTPPSASTAMTGTTIQQVQGNLSAELEPQCNSSSSAQRSSTPTHKSMSGKHRKRTTTPTSSLSPALPLPSTQPVLPGQTARAIHHSYGTRAASRTPTRIADSVISPQLQGASKHGLSSKYPSSTESVCLKPAANDSASSDAQNQMAKHRGRTKKGRIAAALSEAFKKSSQSAITANFPEHSQAKAEERGDAFFNVDSQTNPHEATSHSSSHTTTSSSTTAATTSTTTALTEAKRSAPRAYRKRLIQSVVSSQSMLAKKEASEDQKIAIKDGSADSLDKSSEESSGQAQLQGSSQGLKEEELERLPIIQQLREALNSPITTKRKKKGKTRRMLLSSQSNSEGVRVRAPPKKRAKMELEFEKLMREEMEEEEEEEEAAASAAAAGSASLAVEEGEAAGDGVGAGSGQQMSSAGRRIKMPSTKPGKRPRWIKNDQLSSLLIQLNQKAGSVADGDCVYTCRLCNNQFMLPKRCLSHIMTTHKVPESEVIDSILVRQREEGENCTEEVTISDNLVCDICGYRSRDNTTYYLHYHKYFKHGIPLPQGWSAYTCDLCGKELYTKFQLKDHKRTHAEKTPFVCEVCGSGFQSRSNMHSHVLHRHKEEKKHSCDKCDRTFKTRTQLAVHERTHTGLRPFGCTKCSYRSTTRGNMRLHLVNRHKVGNSDARDIMRDMKPDIDLSLKPAWQQPSSDSGGEKKSSSLNKRKSGVNTITTTTTITTTASTTNTTTANTAPSSSSVKQKTEAIEVQSPASPQLVSHCKQEMVMDSSAMDLFLKSATGEVDCTESMPEVKSLDAADLDIQPVSESSVMLAGEGEGSVVTLQAAEAFPATGVCGETVTFLPPGLETVFHQQQTDLSVATTVPSSGAAATTIIVPENFLLQHQAQSFQQTSHKQHHMYQPQPQHQFTSFVVGATPTLQTFTSNELVVSATTLTPGNLKVEEVAGGANGVGGVVDLVEDMGVMDGMEGALRQSGSAIGSTDLNLQAPEAPATQHSSDHLYMQHSPISPAPPMSPPQPVYVAVTPTHQPLKLEEEGVVEEGVHGAMVAAGSSVMLDQVQQGTPIPYNHNLLQACYNQFYSHSY